MNVIEQGKGIATVEGGHVAYLVTGEGPPLVVTHPYLTPYSGYDPIPGFTTITVWPRGFGDSSQPRTYFDYGF